MERYFKLLLPAIANSVDVRLAFSYFFTSTARFFPLKNSGLTIVSLDSIENAILLFRVVPSSWKLILSIYNLNYQGHVT